MTLPSAYSRRPMAGPRVPFVARAAPPGRVRSVVLFLLMFAAFVSPLRLNVGTLAARGALHKTVDVRAEDVLLAGILCLWAIRPGFVRWRSPLKVLIVVYLVWSAAATGFGIAQDWVRPLRAFFFTAKEIEYFVFFAVGLLCVRNAEDAKAGIAGLVAGIVVQGLYAIYQLATGQYTGAYAVGLLGELNPHAPALCGCLALFLGMALFDPAKPRTAILSIGCAALGAVMIVGSMSRTGIFSAGAGALALLLLEFPRRRGILPRWAPVGLFVVAALSVTAAYAVLTSGDPGDRVAKLASSRIDPLPEAEDTLDAYRRSRLEVYRGYWDLVLRSPIIGNGKAITGHSEDRFAETHNYYLRLVVETGIVGLLLYLAMIVVVLRSAYRLYRRGHPPPARRWGLFCLVLTVVLLVAAMAQDIFVAPRIAELYWIAIGMLMGLERLEPSRRLRPARSPGVEFHGR